MALDLKLGTFTLPGTSTDITITGVGFQPKVILFFYNEIDDRLVTSLENYIGSGTPMGQFMFGAATMNGENISFGLQDANNGSIADQSFYSIDRCLYSVSPAYSVQSGNFLSDGFILTHIGITDGSKVRIHYLALGGSDITDVKAGYFSTPTSVGLYDINSIGFQPDLIIMGNNYNNYTNGSNSSCYASFGMATGPNEQGTIGMRTQNPNYRKRYIQSGEIIGIPDITTTVQRESFVLFQPSGIRMNKKQGTSETITRYVAIKGGNYHVNNFPTRTDYGIISVSGVEFSPDAVLFTGVGTPFNNIGYISENEMVSIGIATVDEQIETSMFDLNHADPARVLVSNYFDKSYINIYSGGLLESMEFISPTINGFNTLMNYTELPSGSAVLYLAIGSNNQPNIKHAYVAGSGYMMVPNSDITISGAWKNESDGTTLYPSLADLDNETTYVKYINSIKGAYFEQGLTNVGSLVPSGVHILSWNGYKISGSHTTTLTCELRQGSGVITSDTRTIINYGINEFSKTLTQEEVSNITNYDDLIIRFTITNVT